MESWSRAFAARARSDLAACDLLAGTALPACHRLHYLQMWLEKLCKAYLWRPESAEKDLRARHNVVGKVLPQLVREHWRRVGFTQCPDLDAIRRICREIDLLHPQVDDDGRRPDNVEYPWRKPDGSVACPAGERFALAARVQGHTGLLLMKAAKRPTDSPATFTG